MIVKQNETRTEQITNATINGFNLSALLESAAVNTDVPVTDYTTATGFDPSQVNIDISLKRDGVIKQLINTNLGVVAQYLGIMKNGYLWRKGINLQKKAAGATHIVARPLFIHLGGHYNLKGDDMISCTVTVNRGTFGSGVSSATSTLQIEANNSIGIEYAIHKLNTYAIQASQESDSLSLGDNVTRVAMMSFETNWELPIFKSASLSSDRLDWTANEQELILRHWDKYPYNVADNLLSATATNANPSFYPNTFLVHDNDEIDRAKLSFTMNSANVAASKNFIVWTTYESSREIVQKALNMKGKHEHKNIDKLPLSV